MPNVVVCVKESILCNATGTATTMPKEKFVFFGQAFSNSLLYNNHLILSWLETLPIIFELLFSLKNAA